jgi:hypothetical protein
MSLLFAMLGNASKMRALIGSSELGKVKPDGSEVYDSDDSKVKGPALGVIWRRQWMSWIALRYLFFCLAFTLEHGSQALLQEYELHVILDMILEVPCYLTWVEEEA